MSMDTSGYNSLLSIQTSVNALKALVDTLVTAEKPAMPAPVIGSFSPASGPVGTVIALVGSGFTGATAASIGGVAASAPTVHSDTSASVTAPSGAASGAIKITGPGGTGASASSFSVSAAVAPPAVKAPGIYSGDSDQRPCGHCGDPERVRIHRCRRRHRHGTEHQQHRDRP